MGLFICLPPVLCALFTFSFFFPCSVTCFLPLPYFFCDFVYVKASYWNLLLFFRLFYLRRMDVVLSSCQSTVLFPLYISLSLIMIFLFFRILYQFHIAGCNQSFFLLFFFCIPCRIFYTCALNMGIFFSLQTEKQTGMKFIF